MLLVFGPLVNGGIQTLIVRIANHLANIGQPVGVCCGDGSLVELLDRRVDLLLWTDARQVPALGASWLRQQTDGSVLVSFDPISAALGLAIEARLPRHWPATHISGVYHQRAFFMTGERADRIILNRLVARAVGLPRLFFQNAETRRGHRRLFGAAIEDSVIIPLGVTERDPRWVNRGSVDLTIVSVGRLVDFKAYNVGAPAIVRAALDAGRPIRWDIYGTGPLTGAIQREIQRHSVQSHVRLLGDLPYAAFDSTVGRYDLFVGCGTAALEAAMLGVPVIGVTDSSLEGSYGFLDELPFGNTGELQEHPPPYTIGALIEHFRNASLAERQAISHRTRAAALPYEMGEIVNSLERLANAAGGASPYWRKRLVAQLYRAATLSWPVRFARKVRASLTPSLPVG